MKATGKGFATISFRAAEAKPLIRSWLDELLSDNGYTVKKTSIYKIYPDFKVTWHINTKSNPNFKGKQILEGIRITFVAELWMTEIRHALKMPQLIGNVYDEKKDYWLERYDVDHEFGTRTYDPWDVYSAEDLQRIQPSMHREAQKILDMFDSIADPLVDFDRSFAISQSKPFPMASRQRRLIALYRVALCEGIKGARFLKGVKLWHEKHRRDLMELEIALSTAPKQLPHGVRHVPVPSVKKLRKHGTSEAMIARILDPLHNYDVLLEEDNQMFRNLARALGQPEDIWTIKNPRTGR